MQDIEMPELDSVNLEGLPIVKDVEIKRKVGAGNFGEVFLGTADGGATKIALKKLKSKKNTQEFLKEISNLTEVKHPNCVQFMGLHFQENKNETINEIEKEIYMVLEFVENGSVLNYLRNNAGQIKFRQILDM